MVCLRVCVDCLLVRWVFYFFVRLACCLWLLVSVCLWCAGLWFGLWLEFGCFGLELVDDWLVFAMLSGEIAGWLDCLFWL